MTQSSAKKPKRNERLVYMTHYLVSRPNQLVRLSDFATHLMAAKSSISEDVSHLRTIFADQSLGEIETISGAGGGIKYRPRVYHAERQAFIQTIKKLMHQRKRILPGNYIQLLDILQDPECMDVAAKIIAEYYQNQAIDAVVTIEAKGIGLATAVARILNVPFVVVRRNARDTIGSTISVNYVSGSHQHVTKMELPTDSLNAGDRVLIIDDFLRHGGTVSGLIALLEEFRCQPVGVCVMVENMTNDPRNYTVNALFTVNLVYNQTKSQYELQVEVGEITEGIADRHK